jgi:DHA2 family multidrug resistance protein
MPEDTSKQNIKPGVNPWIIALAVILPAFMEVIDTSIASVCVPYIAGSLSASNDEATYVLTFYLLSNAVVLPASAWFGLKFGRKRFLITSIVIFTIASFFCGAANSLIVILVARLIQGAGGGALQPISQAILTESFPPEKRGMAMGLFGLGVVVAPVLGPTLGGWLTDNYSWRWAFYINIPIGIIAIFLIMRFIEDPPYIKNAKPGKLDAIGFGLLAVGLGCLQIILDRGQQDDWFGATWIRITFVLMILTLGGFIYSQLTRENTLVDLRIFKNRNFAMGSILIFMFGAAVYSAVTLLPLYYQSMMDYSAWTAGLVVSPRGLGSIIAMPLVGLLVSRVDSRYLVSLGFTIFGFCSLVWGTLTLDISPWTLLVPVVISGFSLGLVFVPLSVTSLGGLKPEQVGNGSGLYNLMRNIGGSVGISVVETMLARRSQYHQTEMVKNLSTTSVIWQQNVERLTHFFSGSGSLATAHSKAIIQIGMQVQQQAELYSYLDDFRYMALACFCCVPMVWLVKRVKAKAAVPVH